MKIFYNFTFRLVLCCVLLSLSVIFPMYYVMPLIDPENRFLLLIGMIVLSAIEIALIAYINVKLVVRPMCSIVASTKKLAKGEHIKVNLKKSDLYLQDLAANFNATAHEFENLEQARKSFISNASHELRSPLTSIQGFLQAMLDGTIAEEEREKYLKIVLRETKRLSSLINSMLDLSRMESGKYQLQPSRFEINSVIRQVIERFEPNLIKKEIQLDVDFVRDTSYVYADKDKIVQVLVNLIDNAIKYSPAYSRILITTQINGKKLYVTVKDKGFGISKKDQLLIWDKFYMADKARTPTKSKGTGLGLSIVKKIIDDHNEVIWVESNKGAGATFIFTLSLFDPSKHEVDNGKILHNSDNAKRVTEK